MKTASLLRIKEPSVCHEIIDGEVVVVDFDSGDYYSMVGSAALIWGALANGASIEQVWARLGLRDPDARRQTAEFIEKLTSAGLIVDTAQEVTPDPGIETAEPTTFAPPAMEKFSDMQELLMADPLHDVDEFGWPSRKADPVA